MFGIPSRWGMVGGVNAHFLTWMVRKNGGFARKIEQMSKNMTIFHFLRANEPLGVERQLDRFIFCVAR